MLAGPAGALVQLVTRWGSKGCHMPMQAGSTPTSLLVPAPYLLACAVPGGQLHVSDTTACHSPWALQNAMLWAVSTQR